MPQFSRLTVRLLVVAKLADATNDSRTNECVARHNNNLQCFCTFPLTAIGTNRASQ